MARPVTLFTGQWADLPLATLAEKAAAWGFDGLELACWGDHFDVDAALADDAYADGQRELLAQHNLRCLAISTHLVGAGRLRPDRRPAPRDPAAGRLGRRRPRGRAAARGREGEGHGTRRRPVRRRRRQRLHRLVDLAPALLVPAQRLRLGRGRLPRLRRPLEPDPRRLRRGRRPLRARGAPDRDRLRLRHDAEGARRDRPARGLRHQLRPEPLRAPVARLRPRSSRSSPTGSTTSTSRTPASTSTDGARSSAGT